jgi:hypothetical protein
MKLVGSALSLVLVATLFTNGMSAAHAASCPPANRDGKTIGQLAVGGTRINVKPITYPKAGTMLPPNSPLNAGLSMRHQPLKADVGASVITWHVRWAGCDGKLNVVNNKEVGFVFSVTDEDNKVTQYRITEVTRVPRAGSSYKPEWFHLSGERKLVLVTCAEPIQNGRYTRNLVIIAKPVDA